jgi:pimeloyl-ACP methyl ester carboxylesterase
MKHAYLALAILCGVFFVKASRAQPAFEPVQFNTPDGLTLEGRLYPGGTKKGVVCAHMFPADQASYGALAKDLARKGYPVLTFNFRGYGNSGGPKNISRIALDMNAAVRFMAERVTCMVLIGASMGGTASILEGNHPKVKGVVTLSAPAAFQGLDARSKVSELKPPKLFVAAKGDVSAYESAEYFYAHATEPKEILLVEGSAHGTLLLEDPSAPLIKRKLLEFLQSSLGTACDLEPALERTAFFPGVAVYKTLVYSTY